jgi:hypothetical protein
MRCNRLAALKRWYDETDHPVCLVVSRIAAGFAIGAVLGLLVWAFVLSLEQSDEDKAVILATIGTGGALLLVAIRTLHLDILRFQRSKEPLLGVMWKEPGMYPFSAGSTAEPQDIYAEYILWNAGTAPVLVQQPASVITREFNTYHLGWSKDELLRPTENGLVPEKAFPILLCQGETAIWRHYTGEQARFRPAMSEIVTCDQAKAVRFIRDSEGERRFVFEILHFAALPADVQQRDLRRCFVGFSYNAPESAGGTIETA